MFSSFSDLVRWFETNSIQSAVVMERNSNFDGEISKGDKVKKRVLFRVLQHVSSLLMSERHKFMEHLTQNLDFRSMFCRIFHVFASHKL